MKKKIITLFMSLIMLLMFLPTVNAYAGQTIYNNKTGNQDGYDYELWKDSGNTSMTLNGGGAFNCQWSNINNALFRKGKKFGANMRYDKIGNITFDYGCDYKPSGNSYLCVYGWTKSPLVEYYIVDSWGSWRPPGASPKGSITVDGGVYDVYQTTRVNQPSIEGNKTFSQYWSVRRTKRTSGRITVTDHFRAWERMGMRLGNIYEAALNIEGFQSSGQANVYKNIITVGGSSSNNNGGNYNSGNNNNNGSAVVKQCESMQIGGKYTGKINSPFNGVALYANNDSVKFTQNFGKGTHNFALRGCSNNKNMARVDLKIGGQYKGTFYYGGPYPATYTLNNVSHGTGNQMIELVVTADDGNWDALIDSLTIS